MLQGPIMNRGGEDLDNAAFVTHVKILSNAVNQGLDATHLFLKLRSLIIEECGYDRCGIFAFNPITETMNGVWGTDAQGNLVDTSSACYPFVGIEEDAWLASQASGKHYRYRHFEEQEKRPWIDELAQVRDHVVIYLHSNGKLLGYFAFDNLLTNRPISEQDAVKLLQISEFFSITVHNALYRAEREALDRQRRQIMQISATLTSKDDPETVYLMVRNAIMETELVDRASLWIVKDSNAHGTWGTDVKGGLIDERDRTYPIDSESLYFRPADIEDEPYRIVRQSVGGAGESGEAYYYHARIPLRVSGELVGIVMVDTVISKRRITPTLVELLLPLTDQAAVAIQQSQLRAEREAVVRRQRRIMAISIAISSNENPNAVFKMVYDGVRETGVVDRLGLWLVEGDYLRGTWGTDESGNPTNEKNETMPLQSFAETFKPCLYGEEEYSVNNHSSIVTLDGFTHRDVPFGVIPLKTKDVLVGLLTIDNLLTRRPFRSEGLDMVLPLAQQAAVVVKNIQMHRAMEEEIQKRTKVEAMLVARADELLAARDEALAGTRAKSEFLANMSHEIRTPMNGVIGMTSMLMQTPLTLEQQGYANVIQESAGALLSVVEDILDVSRLEAGMLRIDRSPFNIRTCIEDVVDLVSAQLVSDHVEVNCFIPVGFPENLIGDGNRIRQVATNLIGNSIKFTPQGSINLQLSCLEETDSTALIRLEVRDTGIGIPKARQSAIFDSFTQVDGSLTRKHGGAGLGLTITKQIVELMGGTIGLKSRPGRGSTFWLDIHFEKQREVPTRTVPKQLSGVRALLMIENAALGRLFAGYIRANGGTTVSHRKDLAKENNFGELEVIVMDYGLAHAQDPLLAKVLMKSAPVIMLCSAGVRYRMDESLCNESATILTKPLRPLRLVKAIASLTSGELSNQTNSQSIRHPELGLRILLAEDNEINAMVAIGRLGLWGCNCTTVQNGKQVLEAWKSQSFDVILMDVSMPIMDGVEATHEIRLREKASGQHIPIIAMTAHALDGFRDRCIVAGMDDYVSKPVNFNELLNKLKMWGKTGETN